MTLGRSLSVGQTVMPEVLHRELIHLSDEYQGRGSTEHQRSPRDWLPGKHPEHQDRQT